MNKFKGLLKVILMIFVIFAVITLAGYIFIESGDVSIDTVSWSFDDKDKKIEFLKKYLNCCSEILDSEYHIYYIGHKFLPIPHEWDKSIAIRVKSEDVEKWETLLIQDFQQVEAESIPQDWIYELKLDSDEWKISSVPTYYESIRPSSSFILIYREEGIIYIKSQAF